MDYIFEVMMVKEVMVLKLKIVVFGIVVWGVKWYLVKLGLLGLEGYLCLLGLRVLIEELFVLIIGLLGLNWIVREIV